MINSKKIVFLLILLVLTFSSVIAQPPSAPATPDTPDTDLESGQEGNTSQDTASEEETVQQEDTPSQEQTDTSEEESQQVAEDLSSNDETEETKQQESSGLSWLWLLIALITMVVIGYVFYKLMAKPHYEITQAHKDFLQKCKRQGLSRNKVMQKLKASGYDDEAIREIMKYY